MSIPFARLSLGVAVLLAMSTSLRANDVPTPVDAVPSLTPATPAPAQTVTPADPHIDAVPFAPAPYAGGNAPGGDAYSGMRVGSPYYWSAPGAAYGYGFGAGYGQGAGYGPGVGGSGCGCQGGATGAGYGPNYGYNYGTSGYGGGYNGVAFYGAGYGGGGYGGDPYYNHFGPGFYRNSDVGHARFPWYSYRRPWYYPGHPSYNRDTNLPW